MTCRFGVVVGGICAHETAYDTRTHVVGPGPGASPSTAATQPDTPGSSTWPQDDPDWNSAV